MCIIYTYTQLVNWKMKEKPDAKSKKKAVTQEDIMKLLDACHEKCLDGISKVSPGMVWQRGARMSRTPLCLREIQGTPPAPYASLPPFWNGWFFCRSRIRRTLTPIRIG